MTAETGVAFWYSARNDLRQRRWHIVRDWLKLPRAVGKPKADQSPSGQASSGRQSASLLAAVIQCTAMTIALPADAVKHFSELFLSTYGSEFTRHAPGRQPIDWSCFFASMAAKIEGGRLGHHTAIPDVVRGLAGAGARPGPGPGWRVP
jgi:hypothetical protein